MVRSELTYLLMRLDKEYTERRVTELGGLLRSRAGGPLHSELTPDLLHAIYGPAASSRPITADELRV